MVRATSGQRAVPVVGGQDDQRALHAGRLGRMKVTSPGSESNSFILFSGPAQTSPPRPSNVIKVTHSAGGRRQPGRQPARRAARQTDTQTDNEWRVARMSGRLGRDVKRRDENDGSLRQCGDILLRLGLSGGIDQEEDDNHHHHDVIDIPEFNSTID